MNSEFLKTFWDTLKAYLLWFKIEFYIYISSLFKTKKNNRHVVLLAWAFPPNINPGIYRPVSIVKYLVSNGWQVTVIAGPKSAEPDPAGEELLTSLPPQCIIHYLDGEKRLQHSYSRFPHLDGGFAESLQMVNLCLNRLKENIPAIIMASGPPFNVFVAACYLSRIWSTRLILDYRDEWTECPFAFVSATSFDRKWEARCLTEADRVFFTTARQLQHQVNVFKELHQDRCCVVPNGWEPSDFTFSNDEKTASGKDKAESIYTLSFIGTLGNHTLPKGFLDAVADVFSKRADLQKHFYLQFIGQKSSDGLQQLAEFKFQQNLVLVDHVTKHKAASLMMESDGLLLFYDKKFTRYIPGKLYDYLASGSPIILFGEDGEAIEIIRELEAGYIIPEGNADLVEEVFDRILAGPIKASYTQKRNDWLQGMTREQSVNKMLAVISGLDLQKDKTVN